MTVSEKTGEVPRILVLGDAAAPTGYSRVVYEIIKPLSAEFEIYQLGVNYFGQAHDWPWKIYMAKEEGTAFGYKRLESLLDEVKPDIIFMLNDDMVLSKWMKVIRNWKGRAKARVIIYCPVDTSPVLPAYTGEFIYADRIFTYTEFGRNCFTKEAERNPALAGLKVEIMPHGVDTTMFYPAGGNIDFHLSPEGRLQSKRRLAGGGSLFDDSFIVLNANRNQERKRLDITIRGFAAFAKDKPDSVMLYLHCGVKELGWNVIDLARREGIYERLIMTTTKGLKPAVSNMELNAIYNACDVGINTSSAEGWGLVSFEHAAAGAAQLVPGHSGCEELWKNHAGLLPPSVSITDMEQLREYNIISPETVAASLEQLYTDRNYLREMSLAACKNANRPEYSWRRIAQQWRAVFYEELAKLPFAVQQGEVSGQTVNYSV